MRWSKLIALFTFVIVLAACAQSAEELGAVQSEQEEKSDIDSFDLALDTSPEASPDIVDQDFPIKVEINGIEVTLEKKPERIVAISLDTADAVLELTDASHVVAVADSIQNPHLAFQTNAGSEVANYLSFSASQDPEKVLAYDPDLILLTKQHEGEMDAEKILMQSGIPLVSFQPWNTVEEIGGNIRLIGKLIGEEQKAEERVNSMHAKILDVQNAVQDIEERRSVLVISPVGTNTGPYILGIHSLPTELLRLSGAVPAAELMGLEQTMPASIEQVIKVDPEYILLTDWDGEGESVFESLMEDPGWSTLQAVQKEQIKMIDAKYVITPNLYAADGIEKIARWLYPERFEGESE